MNTERKLQSDATPRENHDLKEALDRVPTSFRLASWLKNSLIILSEKTGLTVAKIIEVAIMEYLRNKGMTLVSEPEKVNDGIIEQLAKLNPTQIYKLLTIHLRRVNDSFDVGADIGITLDGKGFKYYNSKALSEIFISYFKVKKLAIPSVEQLVKDAAEGYTIPWIGFHRKLIKMTDAELKDVLLAVAK